MPTLQSRDGTTLRALVVEGLVHALAQRRSKKPGVPPLLVVYGNGLTPGFAQGGWEKIRHALYEGRGA